MPEEKDPELPIEPEEPQPDDPPQQPSEEDKAKQKEVEEHNDKLGVKPQEKKPKQAFQDRIDELTKSFRSQERKSQELEKRLTERDADIDLLRKHNDELIKAIHTLPENKPAPPKTQDRADQMLANLRTQKKQALTDVNYERAFELQDQIDDLLLAMSKSNKPPDANEIKTVAREANLEQSMQQDVENFCERNKWFLQKLPDGKANPDYDPIRAAAAEGLEAKLIPTWKGKYGDLLKKVETEVAERFDATPQPVAPKPKVPIVQGPGGLQPGEAPKVQLSAEQRRIVANMFPEDPEGEKKYMEQLGIISKRRGA